ncbi:hypothetical protein [Sanguibacter sp. HDW7]|uniref:hypothetical protein n=1 Tax=Sanguibacter sp. HDW7 TaxID=2714931 RepID=UPI00140BE31B|nr:hypothetical protein [Sanguibacter sp. HDW7]QIK82990.1 hypothetical protein G7063_04625 [Sanguibacter sp. HDW7]
MRTYATLADVNGSPWRLGLSAEAAEDLIALASADVERLTMTAVYEVDTDGLPTDPVVRAALRDATCATVAWLDETGDTSGAAARYNSLSLGSFSVSGGGVGSGTNTDAAASLVAPRAITILQNAGLIGRAPRTP